MFRTIFIFFRTWIIERRCEHDDKVITIPIDFSPKKNNQIIDGIIPNMMKQCKKCNLIRPIK